MEPSEFPSTAGLSDDQLMMMAVEEGRKCQSVKTAFNVGAVIVKDGKILATGFSRELPGNTHAEESALLKLQSLLPSAAASLLAGSEIYTTMEPCTERLSGKAGCTSRLLEAKVKRVVVGVREPDTFVRCVGIETLREAGVAVDFTPGVQAECEALNVHLKKEKL